MPARREWPGYASSANRLLPNLEPQKETAELLQDRSERIVLIDERHEKTETSHITKCNHCKNNLAEIL